ncbi:GMC oxidoreductase [Kitasatospora sp. MAP5-34]|uniref:GMC oxidoreductase n=1 Tax=Kitasatospora sp. MAP5-34 TaxID=3035102 RepID=UPI002474109C|nr:GMC oxidoreductase [Kitasatospora sp. MAP5-34]MDH6579176.1 choline dehydrogenase-like flavoprotein [Kitasatospora sp. MAP5-34]
MTDTGKALGRTLLDLEATIVQPPGAPPSELAGPIAQEYFTTLDQCRGKQYDAVVVGAGAVGSTVVHRLLERGFRVLLLEKGPFLLPEHVQNIDPVYQPLMNRAVATPWDIVPKDGYGLAPQIPYVGGRALFWSTWIPQPTREQMPDWPQDVFDALRPYWRPAHEFLGSVEPSDMGPEFDTFHPHLVRELFDGLPDLPGFIDYSRLRDLEQPLASRATRSTLGYRKFSPAPVVLADARRYSYTSRNGSARLSVVPDCLVERIEHKAGRDGGRVATGLVTSQGAYDLKGVPLVLANGVIEPTGLLMYSFGDALSELAGKNLGGHVADWFTMRVPRDAYRDLPDRLQISCTYLEGTHRPNGSPADTRDFHIHLMGASNPRPDDSVADLYRLIPDSFDQDFLAQLSTPDHVGFLVHCLGEWRGERSVHAASHVSVNPEGVPQVRIDPNKADKALAEAMDESARALVGLLARGHTPQYWDADQQKWTDRIPPGREKKLLVHESGTLWMGEGPEDSVTDHLGRPHGVQGVHVAGAAIFPSSGSWNPTLTAVALGLWLADRLPKEAAR